MKSALSEFYVDAWKESCTSNIDGVIEVHIDQLFGGPLNLAK